MSDIVFIEQLEVQAILGILPEERITPQRIVIDLQLETDSRPAAQSKTSTILSTMQPSLNKFVPSPWLASTYLLRH